MIESIKFTKMHGLGNCYIYLDGFETDYDPTNFPEWAIRVSDPNTGIGSDGLIAILPSEKGAAKMRIYNKDGSEAKNCGNGLRCVAKYVYEKGYTKETSFPIETASGMVSAEIHLIEEAVSAVTINMGQPILEAERIPMVTPNHAKVINERFLINDKSYSLTGVSMGNPHAILLTDSIKEAPIHELGPILADGHELFPEGVNVGFVQPIANDEGIYRVWERGSGITQACGTGACAAAVALILNNKASIGTPIKLHLDGGDLVIKWDSESRDVFMTGPAVTVCEGVFYLS